MPSSDKVIALFREWVGQRAEVLERFPADVITRIASALAEGKTQESDLLRADSIGQHLVEWHREAAFLVSLTLFPEKFTNEEIRKEIDSLMWDVPAHILEAARLGGYPVENIFKDKDETTSS